MESKIPTLIEFIGTTKFDEHGSGYIWGIDKKGDHQMLADVRAWGAIQNLFKNSKGEIDFEKAEKFQDDLGKFIADAMNEKVKKESHPTLHIKTLIDKFKSEELPDAEEPFHHEAEIWAGMQRFITWLNIQNEKENK